MRLQVRGGDVDQDRVLRLLAVVVASVVGLSVVPAAAAPGDSPSPGPTTTIEPGPGPDPDSDPGADGDAPSPEPLADDEIPESDADEPPPLDDAVVSRVIAGTAAESRAQVARLEADLAQAESRRTELRKRVRILGTYESDLDRLRAEAVEATASARGRLADRAVGAYIDGGSAAIEDEVIGGDPTVDAAAGGFVRSVLEADGGAVTSRLAEQMALTARLSTVVEDRDRTRQRLAHVRLDIEELSSAIRSGEYAVSVLAAGSDIVITGFVFPVDGEHSFIDSWGYPRAEGRSHEGADLFADRNTPLVAVERGVLARVGQDRLGGTKLWLVGESGTHYYYAHLQRYAVGVADGARVEAGDVIGYVGDSGDAKGTPPHVHFQLHPDGGDPVNPYPLLKVVDDLDREAAQAR